MDLSTLNKHIVEHLRYYGFQVAARIVESEIKGNKSRIVEKPSKLLEILTKGNSSFELPVHRDENFSGSTNTRESSIKSGNRLLNGGKNDNVTITSEDIFSSNPIEPRQDLKKHPAFNSSVYATPDKLAGVQRNIPIVYGNTDGKKKEQPEVKDFRKTFGEKYPIGEDVAFKPAGGKVRPNELSSIAKVLEQYPYGNGPQIPMNQAKGRAFDSQSDKNREIVRFPMLEAARTNSVGAPQYTKPIIGQNPNSYFQDSENGNEDEEARKVRDPNELKFIPYSFNGANQQKVTPNNSRGQRSISVPRKEHQLYNNEIQNPIPNGISYGNRNNVQPPKENSNNRAAINVLKPIPNLDKSLLGKKAPNDEDDEDASDLHSKTVDYSLMNRDSDLSPIILYGAARRGIPKPIVKTSEYNGTAEKFALNEADPRSSISFKPSALITPKKVTKPPFEGLVKEANEPEYVPFRKDNDSFHPPNTTNPLIKNTALDLTRHQPKIFERPNHLRDTQAKREDKTHSMPPPESDYRSHMVFKPAANTDDRLSDFGRHELHTQEIHPVRASKNDLLKEFAYPSNKQTEPIQNNNRNQEEETSYRVFDSFGPINWEKAKQNAQGQLQASPLPQKNIDYNQAQYTNANSNYINQQPPQRTLPDRETSFDPFSHTFFPEKNSFAKSAEVSDPYQEKPELSHKTLEYLKNTTKLTEKEIQDGFDVYVQVLNSKRNPELLMNKEKYCEYMRKMRGIGSPSFNETCFNFAVSALSNDRNTEYITYREVGHLLDLMHPGHPFSFMKFLFKLYQGEEKRIRLKELEAPLRGISSGQLYEIALLLRSSLDYIYEKQNDANARLTFEEYLGYVQDFEPMKIYS